MQAHQEVEAADNKCCDARYVHPKQRELVFRDHLQRKASEHSGGAQRRRSKKRNVSNRCRAHGILSRKCIEPRHAAHVPIKRSRIAARVCMHSPVAQSRAPSWIVQGYGLDRRTAQLWWRSARDRPGAWRIGQACRAPQSQAPGLAQRLVGPVPGSRSPLVSARSASLTV